MRRIATTLSGLVAVGLIALTVPVGASVPPPKNPTLKQCATLIKTEVLTKGRLTIATDNPVYAPWFVNNTPSKDAGYESALAYDIAAQLAIPAKDVKWVTEPYAKSYLPGTKKFDFDINEITYNSTWALSVTFSSSYYNVQQSLVAMKSDPIVLHHTARLLPTYRYGALLGSPASVFATTEIKPKKAVRLFVSLSAMEAALEAGIIDAIVIDTPTGNHVVTWDIVAANDAPLATQFVQFPNIGDEYYSLVFHKGNPLAACVNVALAKLHSDGAIAALTKKWLTAYTKVPTIKP